jgi:hypothetical protein
MEMKKVRNIATLIVALTLSHHLVARAQTDFPRLEGPYLGQQPPGNTPELFAPGIVSTGHDELFGCFTPDGREFYYILGGEPQWTILVMENANGVWTPPRVAPFSGRYTAKFCLSPDGNKVVLSSRRPTSGTGKPDDIYHTYIVDRSESGWGDPRLIEILDGAFAPSMAANGNLYFFMGPQGKQDLYISELVDDRYTKPRNLGEAVNSAQDEADPVVAPDESYLLFSTNREEGEGIYICFKKPDGSWTRAKNMGPEINSVSPANVGSVTPDGKFIFMFGIHRRHERWSEEPLSYPDKLKILDGPGNGSIDIYWVSAKIIDELRRLTPTE